MTRTKADIEKGLTKEEHKEEINNCIIIIVFGMIVNFGILIGVLLK